MDDIAKKIISRGIGCHMSVICTGIFLYADDLFLIAPSFHTLQIMQNVCETELSWLDMRITVNKSVCLIFGERVSIQCANLSTDSVIFALSRSAPYMANIAHVVTGVWCGEVCICDAGVCTVCV